MRFQNRNERSFSTGHHLPSVGHSSWQDRERVISTLEMKNRRLKTQLYQVQEFLKEEDLLVRRKDHSQAQIPFRSSLEVEKKELGNAYKRIYMMEKQIRRLEQTNENVNATKKIEAIYQKLREQDTIMQRLKQEQANINKAIQKGNRLLKEQKTRSTGNRIKELLGEIEYLQDRIKEHEQEKAHHEKSMSKQRVFIKTLESEIVETGVSPEHIQQLRKKAQSKEPALKTQPAKDKTLKTQEPPSPRTTKKYERILSEINLLKKVKVDQERIIAHEQLVYKSTALKNQELSAKIKTTENEITQYEKKIGIFRANLTLNHLKPKKHLATLSMESARSKKNKIAEKRKKVKQQVQDKTITKIEEYSMMISPLFRYDLAGESTEQGRRFTDRKAIGYSEQSTKLRGIHVYINSSEGVISGIRAIYHGIDGELHIVDENLIYDQCMEKFKCVEGEHIKHISGSFNTRNQLQSLTVLTTNSRYCRFGRPQKTSQNFVLEIKDNEYPVCLFGSILEQKCIESLGVEIMKEEDVYGIEKGESGLASNEFLL